MQLDVETLENSIIKVTPINTNKDDKAISFDKNDSFDVDINTSESFVSEFKELLDRGHKNIIFDIQHISYSDSSGLWAFEECHKRTENEGGKLVFINVQPDIMRIFDVVGFQKRLLLADSLENAIAQF